MTAPPVRAKTVTWDDPIQTAKALRGLSGMDALRALQSGDVPPPPIVKLLGLAFGDVEPGKVSFRLVPDESHFNLLGMVHGGAIATLLDTVLGCAVHSVLPARSLLHDTQSWRELHSPGYAGIG